MSDPGMTRFDTRFWWALGLLAGGLLVGGAASAAGEEPAALPSREEGIAFFERRIRPLLADHCYECHGAEQQEGALRLDDWSALRGGGKSGPAIVPGRPDQSLLITAVEYGDPTLQMPPEDRLSREQVKLLRQWVAWGAPHPDASSDGEPAPARPAPVASPAAERRLWVLEPLRVISPPPVADRTWPRTPVDPFVLARLEAAGLAPTPEADRVTLLRRVTLDLTGLPPTPDETAEFLSDQQPGAYERVVDRLLASPRYGERWGRHWLDIARYADSNGSDENIAHGHAWRYRDYVIASLNADKPFAQFIVEQIAGDLLTTDEPLLRRDQFIATAFLSLGPKVLAEVDERKMEMDIIDEQIDTLGQALFGLTLGCARCHDHKFDPITMRDYYALAGIFKSTRTMEHFTKIARWHENEIALPVERSRRDAHVALVDAKKRELDERLAAANQALQAQLGAGAALPEKPEEHYPRDTTDALARLREELKSLEAATPELSTAMGVTEREAADLPIHLRGSHLTLGEVVARGIPPALAPAGAPAVAAQSSGRLELARWMVATDNPLVYRVFANRLWRWHFGRGLVGSTENFGHLGEKPAHPELLDWLAGQLATHGSLKQLHRVLVCSSTYRQGSRAAERALASDPENQLWSRAPLRRLEAEELRDGLLSVSGLLDYRMGGSLLHVKNREFFFDHTSKDTTSYATHRRTVYLPVVRNHLFDVLPLFDYTDASVATGNRSSTTVATQALFLMNGELVADTAAGLADRALAAGPGSAERVVRLYRLVFSREPSAEESADAVAFVNSLLADPAALAADATAPRRAWQTLGQALLMSNEFLYVR